MYSTRLLRWVCVILSHTLSFQLVGRLWFFLYPCLTILTILIAKNRVWLLTENRKTYRMVSIWYPRGSHVSFCTPLTVTWRRIQYEIDKSGFQRAWSAVIQSPASLPVCSLVISLCPDIVQIENYGYLPVVYRAVPCRHAPKCRSSLNALVALWFCARSPLIVVSWICGHIPFRSLMNSQSYIIS